MPGSCISAPENHMNDNKLTASESYWPEKTEVSFVPWTGLGVF